MSTAGFQRGARTAAEHAPLSLLTWEQFQALFERDWFRHHFLPTMAKEAKPLLRFTEPIQEGSSAHDQVATLPYRRRRRLTIFRDRYAPFAYLAEHFECLDQRNNLLPDLPFGRGAIVRTQFPGPILRPRGLREFLAAYRRVAARARHELKGILGKADLSDA